ncbi:MAG: M48 family metallopeptidase [Kiritimatiellae bacterium]|nr:M48 family metallopeptidase [Kiritimatiellia bacterium]
MIQSITLDGKRVEYRLVGSRSSKRSRIRVGLDGVEIIQPVEKNASDAEAFLVKHRRWVAEQLERIARLSVVRAPMRRKDGELLFRGVPTPLRVVSIQGRKGANRVFFDGKVLRVELSETARTSVARSLENWLRKQARLVVTEELGRVTRNLKRSPNRVYVMGQRTKWGNCSSLHNLSFSWRLIMVPEYVLRYLVTHETVHLAVPDHSSRFWLTVKSLCPETELAKQWLSRHGESLPLELHSIVKGASP